MLKSQTAKILLYVSLAMSMLVVLRQFAEIDIWFFVVFNFIATPCFAIGLNLFINSKGKPKPSDIIYVGLYVVGALMLMVNWTVIILGAN